MIESEQARLETESRVNRDAGADSHDEHEEVAFTGSLNNNQAVRDHQLNTEWEYRDVCELCWHFFDEFRKMYFPDLNDCYFHVEPANKKSRLTYRLGDNGIGAEHDCMLNAKWLGRPKLEIGAYVLHALIHMWQESIGIHSKCGGHNKAFLRKSIEVGIFSLPGQGCSVSFPLKEAFVGVVAKIEPNYRDACRPEMRDPIITSNVLMIYACACRRIAVGNKINWTCKKCGNALQLEPEAEQNRYSCDCSSVITPDTTDYICSVCNKPLRLEN